MIYVCFAASGTSEKENLEQPSQSLDLNTIEMLWSNLNRPVDNRYMTI